MYCLSHAENSLGRFLLLLCIIESFSYIFEIADGLICQSLFKPENVPVSKSQTLEGQRCGFQTEMLSTVAL